MKGLFNCDKMLCLSLRNRKCNSFHYHHKLVYNLQHMNHKVHFLLPI